MDTKVLLRKHLMGQLKAFQQDVAQKLQIEHNLSQLLFSTKEWKQAQTIATTLSLPFEFDTSQFIQNAWENKKKVVVPKTSPGGMMDFVLYEPDSLLRKNGMGIAEVIDGSVVLKNEIDLMVVPIIGIEPSGNRIGFGGGYFDRYLKDFSGMTVSFAFPFQLLEDGSFSPNLFDVPIQKILSIDEVKETE